MKRIFISLLALALVLIMGLSAAAPALAAENAPVAENLEITTYRGVSVGGLLSAYDADGGELSFEISTNPVKGEIELGSNGEFIYTPREGKRGRDYFGYKAKDSEGNVSQEATVIIKILKQKKDVSYADMQGSAYEYSAVALSECGIFTGEQIGGVYCFNPDREVSRGEFLSMCMLASGENVLSGVISTGFADDSEIPVWQKGYISTALICGVAAGETGEDGKVFSADSAISHAEAAKMLDAAMNLTPVSYIPIDEAIETELAQACINLSAHGIYNSADSRALTRAEAAKMLADSLSLG